MAGGNKKKRGARASHDPPHSSTVNAGSSSAAFLKRKRSISADRQSSIAPFQTPPTSPATPVDDLPSLAVESQATEPAATFEMVPFEPPPANDSNALPSFSANDIAQGNQEIAAMADIFATMKHALTSMRSACDRLGGQNEKVVACARDIQAAEQLKRLRSGLNEQLERQSQEVAVLRLTLEAKIKVEVEARIRDHLRDLVKQSLHEKVRDKVKEELAKQIPDNLQQQVYEHQRQIVEVRTTLHNSEARRYNSLQTSTSTNARLRPLLRPLPTPEQSPVVPPISRSSSIDNRTALPTPASAFPRVPAPTPIKRTSSNPFKEQPTISALFPADLRSLFALGPDATRRLLRDYGLASEHSTPVIEKPPKDIRLPVVDEEAGATSDPENNSSGNEESHAADMNKFMAHIGVPFLMIPSPKVNEKANEDPSAPMSSKSRRRRFLTPLIIK